MSTTALKQEIEKELDSLPVEDQRKVLDFTQTLTKRRGRGVSGKELLPFTKGFSAEDAEVIRQAVDEDCEKVDLSEW